MCQQQHLFLTAWIAETGEALESLAAAPPVPQRFEAGAVAQVFGTGPTTRDNAMSDMFVACMYAARKELVITTPYFVPDEALLRALCAAPRRGVQTTIVFPARNDSWLVGNACRSTWPDLLECGVAVHEYPLGLLHAKTMTLDGEIALVGSANMDRRSLELNYENNLLVADRAVTETIRRRQPAYLSVSQPVALGSGARTPVPQAAGAKCHRHDVAAAVALPRQAGQTGRRDWTIARFRVRNRRAAPNPPTEVRHRDEIPAPAADIPVDIPAGLAAVAARRGAGRAFQRPCIEI